MSGRTKLVLGLGVMVVFVAVLAWLRSGHEEPELAAPSEVTRRDQTSARPQPRAEARVHHVEDEPQVPVVATEPDPSEARRDHTGEPLSAGPAQAISLPERPEGAQDNEPRPEQSEPAMLDLIARLDGEIATAEASGDEAEAARLQVRRDRLERKLAERRAGVDPD